MPLSSRKTIRLSPAAYQDDGWVFFVTIGTSPKQDVFTDVEFGLGCIEILRSLCLKRGNRVYAHCLMPDHVHLLLDTRGSSLLPSFVGAWKSQCYRLRRTAGRGAAFWQRSFFDHALRQSEDLRAVATYILANPVRRGLVEDFHKYPLCGSFEFSL